MNTCHNDLLAQPVRHLTNEQFDALLLAPDADHPHLRSCELCASQLAAIRGGIGDLRITSVAAADRHYRAAVQAQEARQRHLWQPRLTWALTVAALLFIGLPFAAKFRTPVRSPEAPAIMAGNKPAANLSDEQLLNNIQSDLSASVPAPLLPLDSTTSTSTKQNQ